jgi:hypothetical protein
MTLQQFARHAQAWGADIARWPESLRAAALQLSASPEAEAILASQRELDTLLHAAAPDVAPIRVDRALNRVVTALAAAPPRSRFSATLSRWLIPAAGLACAVGIGALAATIGPLADTGTDETRGVLTMIFDMTSIDQGFSL